MDIITARKKILKARVINNVLYMGFCLGFG